MVIDLEEKIKNLKTENCDICEHFSVILKYGQQCEHITEFGVRWITSTWGWLSSKPKKLVCYDIEDPSKWGANIVDVYDTAKTTTKETTMLTDYTGQMSTEVGMPVSTIAAENMNIRETREIGNYNRTAAGGANYAGTQINSSTVKMNGRKTSVYYVPHPARGLDANVTPSDKKHGFENKKPILDYGDYYINNSYINTLNDNPYVNDIHHQKNYKF